MKIFIKIFVAVSVFFMFSGCSATTALSRYKPAPSGNKKNAAVKPDTSKYSPKRKFTVEDINALDKKNNVVLDEDDDEFDSAAVNESYLDKSEIFDHVANISGRNISFSLSSKILSEAVSYLHTPYRYGGNTEKGIDCSAFTLNVFYNSVDIKLPRSAREQFTVGQTIEKGEELDFGDLVFFKTKKRSSPSHVGIYIGNNKFMHASKKNGVSVATLDEKYWATRYMGARRLEIKE